MAEQCLASLIGRVEDPGRLRPGQLYGSAIGRYYRALSRAGRITLAIIALGGEFSTAL